MLGARPLIGRTPLPSDEKPGFHETAILSDGELIATYPTDYPTSGKTGDTWRIALREIAPD